MDIRKLSDHIVKKREPYMQFLLYVLMVMLIINYMVVTILMRDFILMKFMRDFILIGLLALCVWKRRPNRFEGMVPIGLFAVLCFFSLLRAETASLGFSVLRRCMFPLVLFAAVCQMNLSGKIHSFFKFVICFFAVAAAWGIFQAHVLGDDFLINMGYPVLYAPQYKQEMLYNSYYFGGLGIQRVVSTLSNSNVCGLILGCTLIFLFIGYPYLRFKHKKLPLLLIGVIALGYLLTFSRSNFLALAIVVLAFALPYIPGKKYFAIAGAVFAVGFVIVGLLQGEDGIAYKLLLWLRDSLTFNETSAAGRGSRWLMALEGVLRHPFGLGFGHVGSVAWESGVVEEYYSCENSFLAVGLDSGWLGMILYYGFVISLAVLLKRKAAYFKKNEDKMAERLCMAGFIMVVYFLIVFFFSNHIYDMEAMAIIYVYLGVILSLVRGKGETPAAVEEQEGGLWNKIRRKGRMLFDNVEMAVRSLFWKRQKDTVLFGAWFGVKFADNSRFLFQYLAENKEALGLKHVVWVTRNEEVRRMLTAMGYACYMMDSPESVRYHKQACMHVVCNSTSNKNGTIPDIDIRYSFGAKRVNLWHGVGVVKGVGCASKEYKQRKENNKLVYGVKEALEKIKLYRQFVTGVGGWGDFYFLSPTEADTRQFEQFSYIPRKNFVEALYPRTCPCPKLTEGEQYVLDIMKKYKSVVMYLPTFRTGSNRFDFSRVAEQMEDVLQQEDILWIQKAHSASSTALTVREQGHILNLPPEFDINVIMPHITMLVTDYSSAASDARFFHKPVLFYVPDLEEYTNGDNGVTEEAEELMRGPQFFDIDSLRSGLAQYSKQPEAAKPEDYEAIRKKYWGEDMDMEQIWSKILQATGL